MTSKRLDGATPRRGMTKKRRQAAYDRAGGRCQACGCSLAGGFEVDHVLPLALGGSEEPDNLECLCLIHHDFKTKADVARIAKAKRQRAMSEPRKPSKWAQVRPQAAQDADSDTSRSSVKPKRKWASRPFPVGEEEDEGKGLFEVGGSISSRSAGSGTRRRPRKTGSGLRSFRIDHPANSRN
jgi:hypothetical protein